MSEFSFFWHDYETFGAVPRRDRPAQFAGVRTDAELNEVGEPLMVYCQPTPDYLPNPESCLLTGILPQHCLQRGVPEHQFAQQVEQALALPGTVGVGYNTIRFDDEVTRFMFWRNLIDPYAREWQNQCGRWDLLDVVRTTWALRPEGIEWPKHEDGRPSFKLEHLTAANGLAHEAAHDALSDVRATIALARLIRQKQPRLWDFCLKLRKKDAVLAEIGQGKPFVHISGMYGVERGCMALVWPLAQHPTNKNEIIVWDLAYDPAELFGLDAATARQRMFTRTDELPEGMTRLPVKSIHINKSPIVIGNLRTLTPEVCQRWSIDTERALRHAQVLAERGGSLTGLWLEVYERDTARGPAPDVDEDLYGGFVGPDDRKLLERIRRMPGEELAERVSVREPAFADERLGELLFRYRARNFPATLTEAEQARWLQHCQGRLMAGEGGALTLQAFFEQIDALGEGLNDEDERGQDILGALYEYAEHLAEQIGS
ncbi:exodeoxyribonuclease I [Aquabacterium lacunae]|uniref:Exodeoxyribonuclease I n=1 Tax=Aquabacterium lacunae TaxID=2528630 RepID=A0A4V2JFW7_9BURK|nr:exodeoxyribonuclease I [Aquabacterium lacunae]TBO32906.1 exodeoxyribonuclease I [Aquabacterium lacunae]